MSDTTTEKKIPGRIRIIYDELYDYDVDDCCKIAYLNSSRYTTGTEAVSRERMHEIQAGLKSGELIGLPVYAYIHSGVTIRTGRFSDQWDSGQTGYVYMKREDAIGWAGRKGGKHATRLTHEDRVKATAACEGVVKSYDQYLQGDVWCFNVEKRETTKHVRSDGVEWESDEWVFKDSCGGFFGKDPKENGMLDQIDPEYIKEGYVFTDEKGNPL